MAPENLVAFIETIDQKHDEAHGRLRETLNSQKVTIDSNYEYFRGRIETLQKQGDQAVKDIERLGTAPVNIDKLIFTPRVVFTLLGFLLSIWTFFYATTGSLRTDLHDLKVQIDAKALIDKTRADLQDVQSAGLRSTVDDMKRQLQLQQYEIQNLKDLVTDGKKRK